MRLHEILTEGREADLYHGTDLDSAENILRTNLLKAYGVSRDTIHSFLPQSVRGHQGYVSFSRVMSVARDIADDNDDPGAIFVVDQQKLYQAVGKRMRPMEYEMDPYRLGYAGGYDDPEWSPENRSTQQSEHEEMVYGNIPNFMDYVKQIIVFLPERYTKRDLIREFGDYKILRHPKTIVVRSPNSKLTGRQFDQLLKTKPKIQTDVSSLKNRPEPIYPK